MGITYELREASPEGNINHGCKLVGITSQSNASFPSDGNDVKGDALGMDGVESDGVNKELDEGMNQSKVPEQFHDGLPPGVKPGQKGDPFRVYRYCKQFCLIGVWICIVSYSSSLA